MRSGAVLLGCEHVADLEKLLLDGAEEVQAGLDLRLGVVGLHGGGDHCNEPALGGDLVGVGHAGDVDITLTTHCKHISRIIR